MSSSMKITISPWEVAKPRFLAAAGPAFSCRTHLSVKPDGYLPSIHYGGCRERRPIVYYYDFNFT